MLAVKHALGTKDHLYLFVNVVHRCSHPFCMLQALCTQLSG